MNVLAVMQDATDAASDGRAEDLHGIVCGDVYADARDAIRELIAAAELAADWLNEKGIRLTDGAGKRNLREALKAVQP